MHLKHARPKKLRSFFLTYSEQSKDLAFISISTMNEPGLIAYKVIILGNSAVGKTSLLRRLRDGNRAALDIDLLTPTIGVDLQTYLVRLSNGVKVELQIWDTAGQERFHLITRQYYRGAHGIIFVYDVTNRQSYNDVTRWLHYANDCIDFKANRNQPVFMLLGNKVDLENDITSLSNSGGFVSTDEGFKLHDRCNMAAFYEVSARTGESVTEAFENLAFCLVDNWDFQLLTQTFTQKVRNFYHKALFGGSDTHLIDKQLTGKAKDLSFRLDQHVDYYSGNSAAQKQSSTCCK